VLIMKHVEHDRVFGLILRDLLQEVFVGRGAKRLARNAIGRTRNGETYPVWRPRR
jgi:hypothetical protein